MEPLKGYGLIHLRLWCGDVIEPQLIPFPPIKAFWSHRAANDQGSYTPRSVGTGTIQNRYTFLAQFSVPQGAKPMLRCGARLGHKPNSSALYTFCSPYCCFKVRSMESSRFTLAKSAPPSSPCEL